MKLKKLHARYFNCQLKQKCVIQLRNCPFYRPTWNFQNCFKIMHYRIKYMLFRQTLVYELRTSQMTERQHIFQIVTKFKK